MALMVIDLQTNKQGHEYASTAHVNQLRIGKPTCEFDNYIEWEMVENDEVGNQWKEGELRRNND